MLINYLKEVITHFVNLVCGATKITDTSYFFFYMDSFSKISVVLIFTAKLYHFIYKHVLHVLEFLQFEESNQVSKFI